MSTKANVLRSVGLAAFLALSLAGARAGDHDYHIGVGDTLSLWVAGVPELTLRLPVSMDGNIVVPLAGETQAAGLTLSEVRTAVSSLLSQHMLYQKAVDGRSVGTTISRDQIVVQIDEYRPIYVSGDVSKPGAEAFRPGMTVRQAISVAGGYDLARLSHSDPLLDAFDLRSQQETLWIAYAQTLADVRRIQAEIDNAPSVNVEADLSQVPVEPALRMQIADATIKQFQLRMDDLKKHRDALAQSAGLVATGVYVLSDEWRKENDGVAQDEKDLDMMKDLYKTNTIPLVRLLDARRMALLASSRSLQTMSQLNQLQREAEDAKEKPRTIEAERRITLTEKLREEDGHLASLRAQLSAVADKLLYSSAIKSQFSTGLKQTRKASIYRVIDGVSTEVATNEDTPLTPGDVIEVTFDPHLVADGQIANR